jgi:hypothetical protein
MSSDKYLRLAYLLIQRTNDGTAVWEPTSRHGTFAVSFPDYSVRIALVQGDNAEDVQFQIVNSEGTVIDTFTDVDAAQGLADRGQAYTDMAGLYQQARRQAMGVEAALDKLIEQLGKP